MQRISTLLRERMAHTGMGSSDVARRAGVSRSQLHGYLTGAHAPSVVAYERVLDALGLDHTGGENERWLLIERAHRRADRAQRLELEEVDPDFTGRVSRSYAAR